MQETPYWTAAGSNKINSASNVLPAKTDVVIIGAGYTGLSAALALRKAGVDVTVIDRGMIGDEASSKNGGMALAGLSGNILGLMKQFGIEKMQRFFAESVESLDCVERLVKAGNIDCHFERSGHVKAAAKPSHMEALKREQEFYWKYLNYRTRLLERDEIRSEIASDYYYGGIIDQTGAGIHPAKYVAGLARMALQSGAVMSAHIEAKDVVKQGLRYQVRTSKGDISAGKVVIAANGHVAGMLPWLQRRIIPFDSYMIATEELPQHLAESLIPNNRMFSDTKNILYYFRLSPNRKRLLFGGRAKIARVPVREAAPILHKYMLGVFPQLMRTQIEYAWSGPVCFTFDRFPHLGSHEGIHYALGYCGHGVAMATYFGQKVAEIILGIDNPTIFATKTFRTVPFYSGNPWFLPLVQLYYMFLDRLP